MVVHVRTLVHWLALFTAGCGPGLPSDTTQTTGSSAPASTGGTTPGEGTSTTVEAPTGTATGTTGASSSTGTSNSSSSSASSSSSSSSAATTGPVEPPAGCPGGEPLFQLPELTEDEGLEWCPDGQIHRHTAVECLHPLTIEPCKDPAKCAEPCDEHGDGVCNTLFVVSCGCQYPCTTDADCQPDAACLCNGALPVGNGGYEHYVTVTQCVLANCRTDADCGEFLCALSPGICGYGTVSGLFCHTAQDECISNEECLDKKLGDLCMFEPAEQRWTCTGQANCE